MSLQQKIRQKFLQITGWLAIFLFFVTGLFLFINKAQADDTPQTLSRCSVLAGQIYQNQCPAGWDQAFTYQESVSNKYNYPHQDLTSNGPLTEVRDVYAISYKTVKYACCVYHDAPDRIANLAASTLPANWFVKLTWTAPSDGGYGNNKVSEYDIRYSTSAINEGNFNSATPVFLGSCYDYQPHSPGYAEECDVTGLSGYGQTYYFAIKSKNDRNMWSVISNVPNAPTLYFDVGVNNFQLKKNNQPTPFTVYKYDAGIKATATVINNGNTVQNVPVLLEEYKSSAWTLVDSTSISLNPSQYGEAVLDYDDTSVVGNHKIRIRLPVTDLNAGNNIAPSADGYDFKAWSVINEVVMGFAEAGNYPAPNEPTTFYAQFSVGMITGTRVFYDFVVTIKADGLAINNVNCGLDSLHVPGIASPDKTQCQYGNLQVGTDPGPFWTLTGTPGQNYDVSLEAGNTRDVETSGTRTVCVSGPCTNSPAPEPQPKTVPTQTTEPGLPLITTGEMSFSRPLF